MMWLTTMNPETRRLIKVEPEDVTKMETMFNLLLGNDDEGRKRHIAQQMCIRDSAMHGVEPLGLLGIIAQLGTQVLDMTVDRALIALEVVAQNLLDKLHAVIHATGMTSQGGEQLELRSGKVNFFVLDQNLMTGNIDDQIAKIENLNLRCV